MSKSFENKIRKREAQKAKSSKIKRTWIIVVSALLVLAVAAAIYFISNSTKNPKLSVDWEAYGKALSSIETQYKDCDKIILTVNDNDITKYEYYKLKALNDYTFNAVLKEYEEYITTGEGSTLSTEEKISKKPKKPTDQDILNSLKENELGYACALKEGIDMTYAEALEQINGLYETYNNILLVCEPESDLYKRTEESLQQMQLVAKGMGKTIEEYLEFLADDSRKSLIIGKLEEKWQEEFKNSDFEGNIDEYISQRYKEEKAAFTVTVYGLE